LPRGGDGEGKTEEGRVMKKVLYVDMDNVLVDFVSGVNRVSPEVLQEFDGRVDDVPGIFTLMDPMPGAIEAYHELAGKFDTYILSTSPWENPTAASDKVAWVRKHLGEVARKRLILTHHKNLNAGDFLVDDRTNRGVLGFKGEHIHFGTARFPDWPAVVKYLSERAT
jgi:5'(3')-deoxyribonucleotidase